MGLFNQKNRDDQGVPEAKTASPMLSPASGAQITQSVSAPSTQGGQDVANIGKSISIKGDLTGNEDMIIEGKVEGKVELPNNQLTVGANGTVRAEIDAKAIVVVGRVTGNIHGTERVEIQGSGIVDGDVTSPRLVVAEGAVLNGSIEMTKQAQTAKAAPTAPPSTEVRRAG
ncbi:MAG: polymer-forming cytoskeletal protein [Myxococcota bacterium]